jgi:hypothetical protein
VDGLKVSQRKVLFACLKRNLTRELKVAQLAGYVSEQTGYVTVAIIDCLSFHFTARLSEYFRNSFDHHQ